jgi:hypothetical protein
MALYSCTRVAQHSVIWGGICNRVLVGENFLMVEKDPANPFFYRAKKIRQVLEQNVRKI